MKGSCERGHKRGFHGQTTRSKEYQWFLAQQLPYTGLRQVERWVHKKSSIQLN